MTRKKIQQALQNNGYAYDSIKSIMCGRLTPSMTRAISLKEQYNVPLEVWVDIKSYLQENNTKTPTINANTKG